MLFKLNKNTRQVVPYIQRSIFILFVGFSVSAQTIEDISFGTEDTFEVVTWNIEHFPKKNQTTIGYVHRILKAIDADVYAIQEVENINDFNQLVNGLSEYEGYLESTYFAGLAYIYKKELVQINSIYEIYTTSEYWKAFPRSPMVMDLTFNGERLIIINNHFKCCGDGLLVTTNQNDEEARRHKASMLLKQYIDANFANLNVLLVGDLNDRLTDTVANNVFKPYFDDSENYKFVDYEIATGNSTGWSFPSWPSHVDHILISNELFDEFANDDTVIDVLKVEEYIEGGWNSYDNEITDHRPVAFKFKLNKALNTEDEKLQIEHFTNYPNPFITSTTFSFNTFLESGKIEVFNILSQKVYSNTITIGQRSVLWEAKNIPHGIYIARLSVNNRKIATLKLILNK
mgnify:CR=1 FL=1